MSTIVSCPLFEALIIARNPQPPDEGLVFMIRFTATDEAMALRRIQKLFPDFILRSAPEKVPDEKAEGKLYREYAAL